MNLRQNQKGFTIVELLIVVVVIAILAAISIVAYTGITNRANRSAAMEAANSVKSVATVFQGANNVWPTSKAQFESGGGEGIAKLPSDVLFVTAIPTSAPSNPKTVAVQKRGNATTPTGFIIHYWDYAPTGGGTPGVETMEVGEGTATGTATTDFIQ